MILITRTPRLDTGQSRTLVDYSSALPKISEYRNPLHVFNPRDPCL